jgi:hypothetical protein
VKKRMKKLNSVTTLLVAIALILAGTLISTSITPASMSSSAEKIGSPIRYNANVCIYKNGELVECTHNLITNAGKEMIENDLKNSATVTVNQIAIANNTVPQSPSDTALQGEWTTCGLSKATAGIIDNGIGNWSLTYQWTSTCDNSIVNATGIYDSVSNTLFAETTFTTVTLQNGDKLNVTYTIWVS